MKLPATLLVVLLSAFAVRVQAQQAPAQPITNPLDSASSRQPHEYAVLFQGGVGVTDNRDGFDFLLAGVHAGRVLTNNMGHGLLRGNFEYAAELFPYWQSNTPLGSRVRCAQALGTAVVTCSQPFIVGGTFHGVTFTPIILRWNFARHGKFTPWVQGAGGILWTNHKYPAYGDTTANLQVNGPNGETSVWNFTPQGEASGFTTSRAPTARSISAPMRFTFRPPRWGTATQA